MPHALDSSRTRYLSATNAYAPALVLSPKAAVYAYIASLPQSSNALYLNQRSTYPEPPARPHTYIASLVLRSRTRSPVYTRDATPPSHWIQSSLAHIVAQSCRASDAPPS
jgi:hypothetical protein